MTTPVPRSPSRHVPALFLVALLGVLAVVGIGLYELAGWPLAAAYSVAVLVGLGLGVRRFRPAPLDQQQPTRDHSACSCCSGEPFRGVEVI